MQFYVLALSILLLRSPCEMEPSKSNCGWFKIQHVEISFEALKMEISLTFTKKLIWKLTPVSLLTYIYQIPS